MAKGNLFLGTAAKSVGDVVMYRREGSQVSRVRVRKIANPKTDAQCKQRAIMSAVVKFYQPLADTLERSWQGMSTAKSYAKFLKANATIGRAGGYLLPKGSGLLPFPYKLSDGTLPMVETIASNSTMKISLTGLSDEAQSFDTVGDLSAAFVAGGYAAFDIVTIIVIGKTEANEYIPVVGQFEIDTTSAVSLTTALKGFTDFESPADSSFINITTNVETDVAIACIVSRPKDGSWLRSSAILAVDSVDLASHTTDAAKTAAIESYKGAAASDNPLVYLDGDELQ